MSLTDASPSAVGLDVGSRRVLHPGPLRWLRSLGWGVLLFVLFGFAYGVLGLATESGVTWFSASQGALITAVASVIGLTLYALLVRGAEARWPSELGLRQAAPELLIGLVVGAAMMSVVVAVLLVSGLYEISGPRASSPWDMITVAISSGVFEELMFRAILLRLLMRAFGLWPALTLSAAFFGYVHLGNDNATPMAAAAIAVEAGLMLAAFYLLTGRLWMAVGVHAAWNFAQGWIWGARVSGNEVKESLFLSLPRATAPEWLSGGAFGPEASVPAMIVGTSVAIGVLYWAWRKGNFKVRPDATVAIEAL
ncbi:abortive infection protein [Caulobacter sp. Root655]|uniref:CPBP family intramembrane glutamic endopeptidase n=1 Tax=Caulobacter sp. Root655 TaxID=1736578 RepID=UPI0006F6575A|nr:type II CAAX endopeptidase family protein [Caulobacter sp. Root655]KRA56749.1 abortive infection protein [Caulobacter sp. Root655]